MIQRIASCLSIACLVAFAFGCHSSDKKSTDHADLSDCCNASIGLIGDMPECCIAGVSRLEGATMSGCCETGLAPGTEDAARPECCQAGMAVLNQLPPCCKETVVSGQPSDCCGGMMAALVSANS